MLIDRRGLETSTDDARALAAFDDTVDAYVTFRADAAPRLAEALKADPDFFLANALKGGMALMSLNAKNLERARVALDKAATLAHRATRRERAHLDAFN